MKQAVRLLLVAAITACGADTVAPNTARLIVSLPATLISITRGNRIAVAAEVTREDGPANPVTITIASPTGITASVVSQTTTGTTTTAELAITANSSAVTGRYVVVIQARATGYPDASASLALDLNQ